MRPDVSWQGSLLDAGPPQVDVSFADLGRVPLDETSWIDVAPGWLRGSDEVFAELLASGRWGQREVHMYDKKVIEPRLTAGWDTDVDGDDMPAALRSISAALSQRYGIGFDRIWVNLYRDGRDSVAWHGDRKGAIVGKGTWEPILTEDEYQTLQGAIAPKLKRPGGSARRYLLSGFLRCGECNGTLTGYANNRAGRAPTFQYGCRARSDGGCGKVGRNGPKVDGLITELVMQWLEKADVEADPLPHTWAGEDELADAEDRLARLKAGYTDGSVSAEMFFSLQGDLDSRVKRLRKGRGAFLAQQAKAESRPTKPRQSWEHLTLEQRREVISQALTAIIVRPAGRGRPTPTVVEDGTYKGVRARLLRKVDLHEASLVYAPANPRTRTISITAEDTPDDIVELAQRLREKEQLQQDIDREYARFVQRELNRQTARAGAT